MMRRRYVFSSSGSALVERYQLFLDDWNVKINKGQRENKPSTPFSSE
jgi:hypothetical protein